MRTYRRLTTRLRFEPGQHIPVAGDVLVSETLFARQLRKVKILKVKDTFEHPDEPGVMLMDAYVSMSAI